MTELVADFERAAAEHGRAEGLSTHAPADRLASIGRRLRDQNSLDDLKPLTGHADPAVRSWAGTYLLEVDAELGERTLEGVAREPGVIGLSAEMTLREWRGGRLTLP